VGARACAHELARGRLSRRKSTQTNVRDGARESGTASLSSCLACL
jgi:hypothetical protein